jgi:hypothetical protein
MENDTENTVEPDVTGFGNPSLDSDPIDETTSATIDSLLDEALGETIENNEQPNTSDTGENTDNSLEDSVAPTETQGEKTTGESQGDVQPEPQQPVEPKIDIDPEIAAIEQPRNLSEKNQSNWRKLQETASQYKQQAAEAEVLRQRLSEAEQRKEIPQDYEELKKFRAIFDIKNDPEFKSKYEAPIQSAKESIYGILRKHGAGDEVINSIEEAGGPDKVADSFWKQSAFQKLPLTDSERLKRGLVDVSELKEKQDAEISHAAEHAEEILVQRETQNKEWYGKEVEQIDNYMEEITKDLPWARFVEPLPNATPEQLKQVEDHNKRVGDLATKFNSALWPTTAQERANVAASAVFSHVLTEQLRTEQAQKNALMDQVKQLTSENNKLKGSSKLPKQTVTTQVSNKPSNLSDRIKMNASDAIDLGLDEAGL